MIAVRTLLLAGVALGLAKFSNAFLDQDEGCAAALPNEGGWLTGTEEMPAYWEVYETEDFADMSFYELSPMALEALEETNQEDLLMDILSNDKQKCIACVKKTGFKVMCYVMKKVKAFCAKTKCPRMKKYCKILEKHPKFAYGFIWEKIHPMALGASYCCGHGECKSGINATALVDLEEDVIPSTMKEFLALAAEDTMQAIATRDDAALGLVGDDKGKKCKDCIHHAISTIMHHVWDVVNKYCAKTKDPRIKKMCELIKTHKEVVSGFLFGYVEPWKYGIGYCMGNKKCKHPRESESDQVDAPETTKEVKTAPFAVSSLFEWS